MCSSSTTASPRSPATSPSSRPSEHGRPRPEGVEFGTCGRVRTGMQLVILRRRGTCGRPGRDRRDLRRRSRRLPRLPRQPRGERPRVPQTAGSTPATSGWSTPTGYLYITGRASDMYISGGSNVHPRDIEEKLLAHADVAEAAVLGMPHPTWGEVGVAVWVARVRRGRHGGGPARLARAAAGPLQAASALRPLGRAAEVRLRQDRQADDPRAAAQRRLERRARSHRSDALATGHGRCAMSAGPEHRHLLVLPLGNRTAGHRQHGVGGARRTGRRRRYGGGRLRALVRGGAARRGRTDPHRATNQPAGQRGRAHGPGKPNGPRGRRLGRTRSRAARLHHR